MAYATGLDPNADMAGWRIKQWLFGQLQLAWAHCLNGPICRRAFHNPCTFSPLSRTSEARLRSVAPAGPPTEIVEDPWRPRRAADRRQAATFRWGTSPQRRKS